MNCFTFGSYALLRRILAILVLTTIVTLSSAQTGRLSFLVFQDNNFDGIRQAAEPVLPGAVITITPGLEKSQVTNANGEASFIGLAPGTYSYFASTSNGNINTSEALGGSPIAPVVANQTTQVALPLAKPCIKIELDSWVWEWPGLSRAEACFTFTNTSNRILSSVQMLPLGPISFTPNVITFNPPLGPGQSREVCLDFSEDFEVLPPVFYTRMVATTNTGQLCYSSGCIQIPARDCQIIDENFECLAPNTYSWTFTVQQLAGSSVALYLNSISPSGMVVSPPNFVGFQLNAGQTRTFNVTLSGPNLPEGSTVCLDFFLEGTPVCRKKLCFELPVCNFRCFQVRGRCSGRRPQFVDNPTFNNPLAGENIAVVTCGAFEPNNTEATLGIMNLKRYECMANPYPNRNIPNGEADFILFNGGPRGYKDPNWSVARLGNLFGVCLDDAGNIYVAQSSAYNMDRKPDPALWPGLGPVVTGRIFKIATNNPSNITCFNGAAGQGIVSRPDPSIQNRPTSPYQNQPCSSVFTFDERYPEIGDVCYARLANPTLRRIVATGLDEGMIYVYNMSGQIVQKYDPLGPDNPTQAGFAPYGELIWAVEYHAGRLYYSVWTEDRSIGGTPNQIRSVAFNPTTGLLVASTDKAEVNLTPQTVGPFQQTQPVSDISFKPDGRMGVAQRSMGYNSLQNLGFLEPLSAGWQVLEGMVMHAVPIFGSNAGKTSIFPHYAKVMEFECRNGAWAEVLDSSGGQLYRVGDYAVDTNACGGLDYDFRTLCPDGTAARPRTWFTADALNLNQAVWQSGGGTVYFNAPLLNSVFRVAYGIQGAPFTGGNYLNSILIDLNGLAGTTDKSSAGDIEVPCPPKVTIRNNHWIAVNGSILGGGVIRAGHPVRVQLLDDDGNVLYEEGATFGDNLYLAIDFPDDLPNGTYSTCLKPLGYVNAHYPMMQLSNSGAQQLTPSNYVAGDFDDDNEIGPGDFALLALAFGSVAGDDRYQWVIDADGNGEIGPGDFAILAQNFGISGGG